MSTADDCPQSASRVAATRIPGPNSGLLRARGIKVDGTAATGSQSACIKRAGNPLAKTSPTSFPEVRYLHFCKAWYL